MPVASGEQGRPRPRRLSLPLTFSPSARRRSHRISQPPLPPPSTDDKALPPIPFASPPFMPMYKPPSATSSARLVKNPPHLRGGGEQEEDLWTSTTPVVSTRTPAPSSPKLMHSRAPSGERSRFMRKLNKWTGSQRELDFGCVGEWSDGPADMGDRFYSAYPGGANRASTASSVDVPSYTHSRGASTSSTLSSTLSVSTAASSVPPSPTLPCHPEEPTAPLSPYTSRVPLTPRTAQRKRQSDEDAAVDALNEYFTRVRLSQIEEVASPRASLASSGERNSVSAGASSSTTATPVATPPTGLAISGGDWECEFSFEKNSLHPPRQKDLSHSRSVSHDLEIEFIETGHTTFTPLHVDDDQAHDFPSTFILPEDAFIFPSSASPAQHCMETSPSALSTFAPSDSTDSCETMTSVAAASETTGESNETSSSTILRHRSPVPEHAFDSTLDELSHYFGATSGSSASSSSSSSAYSTTPPPTIRHQHHASLPSLLPPTPISPLRKHRSRFGSQPSSPLLGNLPSSSNGTFQFPSAPYYRTHKRQSASFAAAQRAKLVQAGQASPPPSRVTYDWI